MQPLPSSPAPLPHSRPPRAAVLFCALHTRAALLLVLLLHGAFNAPTRTHAADPATAPTASAASTASSGPARSPRLPQPPGQPGFASAATCAECHRDEHASWHRSFHRSMTQSMDARSVQADFQDVRLESHGERFTLRHHGDVFWAEIEDLEAPAGTPPAKVPMELMTGSHHMQVFWIPAGAGNAQIGFPFTWLIPEKRWVPRENTFVRDPHAPRQIETWNMTCIRCHVTGGQPRPRREQGLFDTRVADLGIACEACHGPAADHVAYRKSLALAPALSPATTPGKATAPGAGTSNAPSPSAASPAAAASHRRPRTSDPRDPIVQPARLAGARASHVCAQCHGMKWFDSSEGWVENGFRYRPGDDLEATTPIVRPAKAREQAWLAPVLQRNPQLLDDFFWPDGMIRVAGREYNGLVESACFQKGTLSCLSCHGLHEYTAPSDQLKPGMDGNKACTACHAPARFETASHTHHPQGSSGAACQNCHMPHTTYALLGATRQHQIDSPRVETQLRSGRPNACNLCHLDRSLAWTRDRLAEWYGHPRTALPGNATPGAPATETSAIVDLLLTGDAGQRALAAWHLGWEPARAVSGGDWQTPLLARTLEDPYAAVRLVAQRALRQVHAATSLPPMPVETPAEQAAARAEALRRWKPVSTEPVPAADKERRARVLLRPDGTSDTEAVAARLQRRNDRPMRLRE